MNHHKLAVLLGILVTDGTAVVRATVVNEDAFPIREGLGNNAVQAAGQVPLHLIHQHPKTFFKTISVLGRNYLEQTGKITA